MPIIKVENLSKSYRIGLNPEKRKTNKWHRILRPIQSPFEYLIDSIRKPSEDEIIWALKEVSFEVEEGEILGIIGKNGAGKTTLLKILSRITEPDSGRAEIKGRVGSLLEVGTGFHPDLTGRENIYLSGTLLGMKKKEIDSVFDEIVNFADIEKFIDTPVKKYSSGMYVRLGFAVAAHLQPEILLIDEVLAVGDAEFQKKCLGKMGDVGKQGRTILFVSHNMKVLEAICTKAILLDSAHLLYSGKPSEVTKQYLKLSGYQKSEIYKIDSHIIKWEGIINRDNLNDLFINDDIPIKMGFKSLHPEHLDISININIYNEKDEVIIHLRSKYIIEHFKIKPYEKFSIDFLIKSPKLFPGRYHMSIYLYNQEKEFLWIYNVDAFNIIGKAYYGNRVFFDDFLPSAIIPEFKINFQQL